MYNYIQNMVGQILSKVPLRAPERLPEPTSPAPKTRSWTSTKLIPAPGKAKEKITRQVSRCSRQLPLIIESIFLSSLGLRWGINKNTKNMDFSAFNILLQALLNSNGHHVSMIKSSARRFLEDCAISIVQTKATLSMRSV